MWASAVSAASALSATSAAAGYYPPASATGTVSVASALVALRANPRLRLSISDTAEAIGANFEALARVANNLTGVAVSNAQSEPPGVVTISAAQYARQASRLLSKFSGGAVLQVEDAAASRATTLQNDARVRSFTVADNSTELATRLGSLQSLTKLQAIEVTTPGTALSLTATQYDALDPVLDKITTGGVGVAVTAATAGQAVALRDDARVRTVAVLDSAGGIVDALEGLTALGARLRGVRSNTDTVLQVSADQVERNALVIGKLYRGHQLAVQGAALSEVERLAAHTRVLSVDVEDTAANVSAHLAQLARLGSEINRIHITGVDKRLSITSREYETHAAVLARIDPEDAYTVAIRQASVLEAQSLLSDDRVVSIDVADTAGALSASLNALAENEKLGRIVQTGRPVSISLTAEQLAGANVLDRIDSQYTLSVSAVAAADALNLLTTDRRVTSLSVTDTGEEVVSRLEELSSLGRRLSRIQLSNATTSLDLTASRWMSNIGTLAKIQGGYGVALSEVSANRAATFADDARVRSLSVRDTAAAVSAVMDELHDLGSTLTAVTLTDPESAVQITGAQFATQAATRAKMGADLSLSVRQARAAQAAALAADSKVAEVDILDSSRNIAANLGALQTAISAGAERVWSIRQAGPPTLMAITAEEYAATADARAALRGPVLMGVSGVEVSAVESIAEDRRVVSIGVTADSARLSNAEDLATLSGLGARLTRIVQSDAEQRLSLAAESWIQHGRLLDKTVGGVRADLTAVRADQVSTLAADWRVASMAVADTGAQITNRLAALQTAGALIGSITQTDDAPISLTMRQYADHAAALAKLGETSSLEVRDASVADAQALLGQAHSAVTAVQVRDTAARVAEGWAQLQSNGKLGTLSLTDPNQPLALSYSQYADGSAVLDRFLSSPRLSIGAVAAADVATVAGDARVTGLRVRDSASAIVESLGALSAAGRKVVDITLEGSPELELSHTQWSAHQAALSRIVTPYAATVNDVPASRALALGSAAGVAAITVRDSAAQIGRNIEALQAIGPALTAITPSDNGTPTLTITAAQMTANAAALAKIGSAAHQISVTGATVAQALSLARDSRVSGLAVSDSSTHIAQNLAALAGLSQLNAITQTGIATPMALSAADYLQYASTLGKIQNGYTVNLSAAGVAGAAALEADARVASFTVSGTTTQVGAALVDLNGMSKLAGITLTQDDAVMTVSQASLDGLSTVLDHLRNAAGSGYRLRVTGVTPASAQEIAARPDVDSLALSTTSQALSEAWADLLPLGDRIASIQLSDTTVPVALDHLQWQTQSAMLQRLQGDWRVAVTDVSAAEAAAVAAEARVAAVSVRDVGGSISTQFTALASLGSSLHEVQVTDGQDIVITTAQSESAEGVALIAKIMGEHEIVLSDAPSA